MNTSVSSLAVFLSFLPLSFYRSRMLSLVLNDWSLGAHGMKNKVRDVQRLVTACPFLYHLSHKLSCSTFQFNLLEEASRVPLIVTFPNNIPAETRVRAP